MFKTKLEVDRHVDNSLRKINNETERNLRCFSFAKLYYNVGDYEQACRYISSYLSVKPKSSEGQLLLGRALEKLGKKEAALEAYRTSLQLDSKQNNLVIKVCELLASEEVDMDKTGAKYFCELAQSFDPHNPVVFNLKERLITSENDDPIDISNLLLKELENRPTDVNLRVKLLKHFLQTNMIKEAYKHASDIEEKNLSIFHSNLAWYETFAEVLLRYQRDHSFSNQLNWEFWFHTVSVFDRLVGLCLDEHIDTVKNDNEYVSVVFNFDQMLNKASQNINSCPDRQLASIFLNHYYGQLYFHLSTLLFKQAKKDLIPFKEALNYSLPVLFSAYHCQPPDTHSVWLNHANENRQRTVNRWYKEACYRCSQTGHILIATSKERKSIIIEKATQYSTGMWREQLFKKLFVKREQQQKMASSYFINNVQTEPTIKLPELNDLVKYDEVAQLVHPDSLHHYIWVARNCNLPSFNLISFEGLQYTIKNLNNCAAESLNILDLQAFIYCATLCAQSRLDESKNLIYYNHEKAGVVMASITEELSTLNQSKFIKAAYTMYKNEYGSNMGELRLLLIKGIEVVRCVGQHGLDIKLLVNLANIFAERSKLLTKQTEIDANDARAELYWKTVLPLLEKLKNNQMVTYAPNRLFEYKSKEMPLSDVCNYIEKGKLFIGVQLMKKKEYERALQIFEVLKDPYASFYQSQIYKHMADQKTNQNKENVTSEMRSQNIILLSRARDCLYLTLDRLREPGVDKSHPLNMQMGNEIEKIERLLSRIDPDCSNRNECDGMSDENVSTDSAGEHYLTSYTTHHTSFHNGVHTPKHDPHNQSTPYRLDLTRREARPSPERLDAQIRQLAASKDIALNTVLEQNKIMIDSHRSLLEELRSFKDAVNNLTATVDDLKTMKSGLDELKEVKKSVNELKQSVDELQNVVDVVHEMKKEISDLKKDSNKNNQLSDEDLYVLDPEYDYNINSNMAAYNQNMYQNYQGRMSNPNSLSYGPAAGLYPGLYPTAMAYAYGGLPLPQPGLQFVPDQQIPSLAASSLSQQSATFGQSPLGAATLPTTQNLNLAGLMPNPVALSQPALLKESPKATLSTFTSTTQSVFPSMAAISSNPSQTSAINKAPPVNVVITASDPLPSNKTSISQPILSVTIPPQHIKSKPVQQQPHNYQIPLPSAGISAVSSTPSILSKPPPSISTDSLLSNIAPPIFSAISNTKTPPKNVTLGLQIEKSLDANYSPGKANTSLNKSSSSIEEYDPCPDFKPIIPLPDEVPTNTGEEHETVLFSQTAKLFRYVDSNGVKEWKERGVGNLKILLNPDTKKIRILMRRDQVFKICANHYLTKDLTLTSKSERAYIWAANDFADEKMVLEKFCVRFKTQEEALKFYNAVEDAKKRLTDDSTPVKSVISKPEVKSTATTQSPATSLGGFVFVTPPTFKPKETQSSVEIKEIIEPAKSSPFANFTFGGTNQNTTSKFKPITTFTLPSSSPQKTTEDEHVEEFVPTAEFQPVIALPDLVTVETGEENSDVLFECRAKLFRLSNTGEVKEWKERGIGTIKVLKDDKIVRVIMRREQVHKVCCNHQVLKDMVFTLNQSNPKAVLWHAKDFSEGELVAETFTARFKTQEQAEQFLNAIQTAQGLLDEQNSVSNKHHKGDTTPKQNTSFGDKFKPAKGSWECKNCYIVNEGKRNHCVACETSKSGTGAKKSDESAGALFSFGINNESKPNTGSWGNAFKPAEGSWECTMCYIRNKADVTKCVSCQSNKDGSVDEKPMAKGVNLETPGVKFSFGIPQTTEKPKPAPQTGFGDMFKPKEGSWSCKMCYVLNDCDKLHCLSCDSPKDDSVPKKETASKGVDLSTNMKFSFGIPATTSVSAADTTQKPFSFNDSSKLGGAQFLFGASKSPASVVTPTTNPSATFPFGSSNAKKPESAKFVFGSPQKHEFEFTPRSPRRTSSGQNDDESDGSYVEEENDNIYFKPVIPLPEKVDVKTGEEQEDVLYCHRAKLFRFVNSEWKERGLGDVKILKSKDTGKLRVVMRREQVFKICLNHTLTKDIEYIAKDEKTWLFHAADYSDGEISHEQFCIRFKDANIAQDFKKAVNDALNCGSSDKSGETKETSTENTDDTVEFVCETKVSSDEEREAIRLGLPPKFFSYKQLPDCKCDQCKEDDVYLKELFDQKPTQDASISSSLNKTLFGTPISTVSSPSVGGSLFGTPNSQSSFNFAPSATATPPTQGETLKDLLRKPKITPSATGSIFGSTAVSLESKPSTPNFTFTLNATPTTTNTTPSIFGGSVTKGSVFTSTLFNTTTNSGTFGGNSGTPVTTTAPSIFGNFTPTTSANVFGNTNNLFTSAGSIFSNTTPTFGGGAANVFGGFTSASSLFNKEKSETVKSDTEKLKEDDEVILKCDTGLTFASLAAKTAEPAFTKTSEEKPFSFCGAGQPVFGAKFKQDAKNPANKSKTESDGEEGGGDEHGEDYDPHYDPIVPLPEAIIVSTGEEGETAMFNERAKVYRFDDNTKEWKERGVGQMKILFHPENLTYRLLLRREQVHKVVLNQLITSDLDVQPMSTSDKAWMWAGHNYTEDELKLEKLAVRFKSVELAKQFNDVIQTVICKVIEITNRKAVPETVRNFGVEDVSDEQVTIEEINDEEEDEEEEEDEKSVMITKPCVLYEQNENDDSWTHVANGDVQIYYDSDCYVAKIWVASDDNTVVSNTLIGSNTLMDIDKNVCIWKAVESVDENNIRWRNLKAEFHDEVSAQLFHSTYLEGLNYAQELGITDEIVTETDEGETEEN